MWLLLGDSLVLGLKFHLRLHFHCECYPGWSSERLLTNAPWIFDSLYESKFEGCVLLVGTNDAAPIADTLKTLKALRHVCLRSGIPKCFVVGWPQLHDPDLELARTFGSWYIDPPPGLTLAPDGVHLSPESNEDLSSAILEDVGLLPWVTSVP